MELYSFKKGLKEGLKRARKEAGFTQAELAEKLKVTLKTIQNWEQNVKAGTLPTMGQLLQLAEFYDCDLDYLTGRIDFKTHDLQFIHDQTGLSEKAIQILKRIHLLDRATGNAEALSFMIEDPDFPYLLALMSQTENGDLPLVIVGNACIRTEKQAVIRSETREVFSQISNHVREKMETVPSENNWIYKFIYGLHAEGRITDSQLSELLDKLDSGKFDLITEDPEYE